jgi:hypothetical protein
VVLAFVFVSESLLSVQSATGGEDLAGLEAALQEAQAQIRRMAGQLEGKVAELEALRAAAAAEDTSQVTAIFSPQ